MKIISVSILYACKFNDPQKRYMNHNYSAEATATVDVGEDPEQVRQQLANDLENFVHQRRTQIYKAAELEHEFEDAKRNFKYAVDRVRQYEEGTRQAKQQMTEANELFHKLEAIHASLLKLGVSADMPKPFIEVEPRKPSIGDRVDPHEEGNETDEHTDDEAGID